MAWLTAEEVGWDQVVQSLVSYAKVSHPILSAIEVAKRNLSRKVVQLIFILKNHCISK